MAEMDSKTYVDLAITCETPEQLRSWFDAVQERIEELMKNLEPDQRYKVKIAIESVTITVVKSDGE